jgi:hypothetical protein
MVEDVNLLKELDELYKDYWYKSIEISKILTTKTVEQIKNKRKKINVRKGAPRRLPRRQREGAIPLTQAMRQRGAITVN